LEKNLETAGTPIGKGNSFFRKTKSGKRVKVTGRLRRAVKKKLLADKAVEQSQVQRRIVEIDKPEITKLAVATVHNNKALNDIRKSTPEKIGNFYAPSQETDKDSPTGAVDIPGSYEVLKFSPDYSRVPALTYQKPASRLSTGLTRVFNIDSAKQRVKSISPGPRAVKARKILSSLKKRFGRKETPYA
jgi:hypothetical protein